MYLVPLHTSQGTYTSGKKCISIFLTPSPRQASHLPPFTLNEKRFFSKPYIFASFVVVNNVLISSNTPVYVAGFDLGVLPIGFWEIATILSKLSIPNIFLCFPGFSLLWYNSWETFFTSISLIREDFPLPDTPVIQVNVPKGISTSIFFKLCSSAPFIFINLPFPFLLFSGTSILFLPLKYCPVMLFSFFITSSGVPQATTVPPLSPAPGPISTK